MFANTGILPKNDGWPEVPPQRSRKLWTLTVGAEAGKKRTFVRKILYDLVFKKKENVQKTLPISEPLVRDVETPPKEKRLLKTLSIFGSKSAESTKRAITQSQLQETCHRRVVRLSGFPKGASIGAVISFVRGGPLEKITFIPGGIPGRLRLDIVSPNLSTSFPLSNSTTLPPSNGTTIPSNHSSVQANSTTPPSSTMFPPFSSSVSPDALNVHFLSATDAKHFMAYATDSSLLKFNGTGLSAQWAEEQNQKLRGYELSPHIADEVNHYNASRILILSHYMEGKTPISRALKHRYPRPAENYTGDFNCNAIIVDFGQFGQIVEVTPVISSKLSVSIQFADIRSAILVMHTLNSSRSVLRAKYSLWSVKYARDITCKACFCA